MSHLLSNLLVFGRLLRTLGLEVHMGRMLDVVQALQHVDLGERDEVYHTCRALLVHRREDLALFDRAFEAFWRGRHGLALDAASVSPEATGEPPVAAAGPAGIQIVGDAVGGNDAAG